MSQSVVEMTKDLVLAQIRSGTLSPEAMHDALRRVFQSFLELKSREEAEAQVPARAAPAPHALADWRQSITRHSITCLECGAQLRQGCRSHIDEIL